MGTSSFGMSGVNAHMLISRASEGTGDNPQVVKLTLRGCFNLLMQPGLEDSPVLDVPGDRRECTSGVHQMMRQKIQIL